MCPTVVGCVVECPCVVLPRFLLKSGWRHAGIIVCGALCVWCAIVACKQSGLLWTGMLVRCRVSGMIRVCVLFP